jgi:hypothetical protein
MVRRRQVQLALSHVVLFGLVLPDPESLMEPWLRQVDKLLEDEEAVGAVVAVMRRRWPQSSRRGRAGTPAEVALRMLALKHLRDWSYVGRQAHGASGGSFRQGHGATDSPGSWGQVAVIGPGFRQGHGARRSPGSWGHAWT